MNIYKDIEEPIRDFCIEFLKSPYLCYTEHGLHALFYCKLYSKLQKKEIHAQLNGNKVCIIQKEYPTADKLIKSKRQHWDIAVIQSPASPIPNKSHPYDNLKLYSAIEFGMNADKVHLENDIKRLTHQNSYVENKYIIHLYRISGHNPKKIYFGVADITKTHECGLWLIDKDGKTKINE